jgi:hypothetical protein
MENTKKIHRVVIECEKSEATAFRARLLEKYGVTVSAWFREQMKKELSSK